MRNKFVELRNVLRLTLQLNIVKKNFTLQMRRQKDLTLLNPIIMKIIMIIFFLFCETSFAIKNINLIYKNAITYLL